MLRKKKNFPSLAELRRSSYWSAQQEHSLARPETSQMFTHFIWLACLSILWNLEGLLYSKKVAGRWNNAIRLWILWFILMHSENTKSWMKLHITGGLAEKALRILTDDTGQKHRGKKKPKCHVTFLWSVFLCLPSVLEPDSRLPWERRRRRQLFHCLILQYVCIQVRTVTI